VNAEERTFIHPDEALRLVLEDLPPPTVERVSLAAGLGRALAADLNAIVDQPPFDKSAMDGFAYRASDLAGPAVLRVAAVVAAGSPRPRALAPGECARIMTGAPLPPGADRVQRVEWTAELSVEETARKGPIGATFVRFTQAEERSNVIRRGENQKVGDPLLGRRILKPQDLGILASSGYAEIPVARKVRVGVLSTGDELATPGGPLPDGGIYDSNGPQLTAQASAAGCEARFYGIVRDEPGLLEATVARAVKDCDVLVVSGGVSMGDFDHVPRAFAAAGLNAVFHGLAVKPGKPMYFGRAGDKSVFGLPGNPVSTFVGFELFVRPQLERRMGIEFNPRILRVRLAAPLVRRESDRVEFLPARLELSADGATTARALQYRGSSMLSVLSEADCLLRMEIGETAMEEGRTVDARLIRP